MQHARHLNSILLRPSLLSGAVCLLAAIAVPIIVNWSDIMDKLPFQDYFFGPYGTVTELQKMTGMEQHVAVLGKTVTNEQLHHVLTVVGLTVAIAIGLFIAVRALMHLAGTISTTLKELSAADTPAKREVEHEIGRRFIMRMVVAGVWSIYILLFFQAVVPFAILASQIGLAEGRAVNTGVYYLLFAGLLLFFTIHVHVIMMRLLLLRPRIFGGQDVIVGS